MRWILAFAALTASAADVGGIWTGQVTGRNGQKDDVAFEFKVNGTAVIGKMFGDEFDLKLEEGVFTGDEIKFIITTTNYYSGNQQKAQYTGVVKGNEMELTRSRVGPPPETGNPNFRQNFKQVFTLKRLTSN